MADDVLVAKIFNFICGSGGFVELSVLLKRSSPLGSKKSELEARNWLKIQGDRPFVVVSDGKIDGVRIRLKKKICQQYLEKGSCRRAQGNCKYWHICKEFIEGGCAEKCGRSHNFFGEENGEKTKQLGLDKYPPGTLKNIVVWSLPQVCQLYLRGECNSDKCFYFHVCSQAVQGSVCNCSLSHNLTDSHNKQILKQFDLVPHQSMSTKFVRCNILVPKDQKIFAKGGKQSSTCGEASTGIMSNLVDSFTPSTAVSDGTKAQCNTSSGDSCSNIARCSKQSESERNSLVKSGAGSQEHSQPEGVQSKATKQGPTVCKPSPNVINNLANNSTSPAFENSAKLMNIQVEEDETRSNSPDENKSGILGFKTIKHCDDDDTTSVKRELSESKLTEQSSGTTDETKGKSMEKQIGRGPACKEPQKKNSASSYSAKKIQSVKKTTPVADSSPDGLTLSAGLEVRASSLPTDDATQDFVKKWLMGSDRDMKDSPSGKDLVSQTATKDGAVERKRRLSVSSSCSSVQDPKNGTPSKKAVFDCILKEYNGSVSFDAISKRKDLFTDGCEDIARWFEARKDSFLLREEGGKILEVTVFYRRARLCFNQLCSKKDCQYFHVCREFVSGFCRLGSRCRRNHSFQYDLDRMFISKMKLDGLTDDQLRRVLQLSTPQVCLDYNDGCCTRVLSCCQVHICKNFVKKQCNDEEDCGLKHESTFNDPHTAATLQKYGLKHMDSKAVLRMLLVCDSTPRSVKGSRNNISSKNIADKESNSALPVSSKGTAPVTSLEPSEMKVFDCLCKEYGCSASFAKISKRTDLFPGNLNNVEAWFRKKTGSFLITEDDQGMIVHVDAYSTKARLCLSYNSSFHGECTKKKCSHLHVCRDYITDSCVSGATCPRNHHFQDERDKTLLSKVKLDTLTDEQLRKLVLSSTPQACLEYSNGMCNRGGSCNKIHICSDHLKKCCSEGNGCDLEHEAGMRTEHTQVVLKRYQMERLSEDVVERIILVFDDKTKGKETGKSF